MDYDKDPFTEEEFEATLRYIRRCEYYDERGLVQREAVKAMLLASFLLIILFWFLMIWENT